MGQSSSKKQTQGTKASSTTSQFPTTPHGSLMYGELARACTVMFGNLDADLHKHILDETPAFTCAEGRMIDLGFAKCVDYPTLPDHVYYEGYFHSCRVPRPIESLNPRNGRPFNKPPAPKALRALYIAFKDKNKALLSDVAQKILELPVPHVLDHEEQKETQEIDPRQVIADMFSPEGSEEILCGDLAIQVHCGTGVSYEHIGWHRDSINSMFHFATSIRGKRDLYSSLSDHPDSSKQQIFVDRLETPNIYISSPANFRHAVCRAGHMQYLLERPVHDVKDRRQVTGIAIWRSVKTTEAIPQLQQSVVIQGKQVILKFDMGAGSNVCSEDGKESSHGKSEQFTVTKVPWLNLLGDDAIPWATSIEVMGQLTCDFQIVAVYMDDILGDGIGCPISNASKTFNNSQQGTVMIQKEALY
eukprot:Em0002g1178a